jgi:hypothetical protein
MTTPSKESLYSKFIVFIPGGGPWKYVRWLEMVQNALTRWATVARNKHEFIDSTATPYFVFSGDTHFDHETAASSKTIVEHWTTVINKQLPQQHPAYMIDAANGSAARSIPGVVFYSNLKDIGLVISAQPVADVNFGDPSIAKFLLHEYVGAWSGRFGNDWITKFTPHANSAVSDNFPMAQFFYAQQHSNPTVEVVKTNNKTYTLKTIHHRDPSMSFCLKDITRPVILQKAKTGLNFELYY